MVLCQNFSDYEELPQERKKLIVYDIGLEKTEIRECKKKFGSMVEFRSFVFSDYPCHVRELKKYRWKPLIIAEMLLEYPVVWWIDSIVKFTNDKNRSSRRLQSSIKNDPRHLAFGIFNATGHSIFAATHPKMYDYFPASVRKAKVLPMADASRMLWLGTRQTKSELLKWWIWCALEEDCMSPPGAKTHCEFHPSDRYTQYADCHRFDQSAISLASTLLTKYDTEHYLLDRHISPFKVDEEATT